jgi:hypothetical protein
MENIIVPKVVHKDIQIKKVAIIMVVIVDKNNSKINA